MGSVHVLLTDSATLELLPTTATPDDVLGQGPFHEFQLSWAATLVWSSSSFEHSKVNDCASAFVGQTVKGDVCITSACASNKDAEQLLSYLSNGTRLLQNVHVTISNRARSMAAVAQALAAGQAHCASSSCISNNTVMPCSMARVGICPSPSQICAADGESSGDCAGFCSSDDVSRARGASTSNRSSGGGCGGTSGLSYVSSGTAWGGGGCNSSGGAACCSGLHATCAPQDSPTCSGQEQLCLNDRHPKVHRPHQTLYCLLSARDSPMAAHAMVSADWVLQAPAVQLHLIRAPASIITHRASHQNAAHNLMACGSVCAVEAAKAAAPSSQSNQGTFTSESAGSAHHCECAPAAVQPPVAPVVPCWHELSDDLVGLIALQLPPAAIHLVGVAGVCAGWRHAILSGKEVLRRADFSTFTRRLACDGNHSGSPFADLMPAQPANTPLTAIAPPAWVPKPPLPQILLLAAKATSVSAMVCLARVLTAWGHADEAVRWWLKCAKAGSIEGQLCYGLAAYEGASGCMMDGDAAYKWLTRALKQAFGDDLAPPISTEPSQQGQVTTPMPQRAVLSPPDLLSAQRNSFTGQHEDVQVASAAIGSGIGSAASAIGSAATPRMAYDAVWPVGCLAAARMTVEPWLAPQLQHAAVVLGYLVYDGEAGVAMDRGTAVRLFKLAAACGSREAQHVLGWLYSTGQYG